MRNEPIKDRVYANRPRKPRGLARFRKGENSCAFEGVPGATSVEIFPADGQSSCIAQAPLTLSRRTTSTIGWHSAMRVRLKGINSITKKLADGTRRTYWYAWKGGPALRGEPGTPEFVASYNEAAAAQGGAAARHVAVGAARLSGERGLSRARTALAGRLRRQIKLIEKDFGDFPLSALTDNRTRGVFKHGASALRLIASASRLCLGRAGARPFMGYGSRACRCQSMRSRREALSRLARGEDLDRRRRGRVPRPGTGTPAPAVPARAVDRTAPRRPAAAALVRLRRDAHPPAAVEGRRARGD